MTSVEIVHSQKFTVIMYSNVVEAVTFKSMHSVAEQSCRPGAENQL